LDGHAGVDLVGIGSVMSGCGLARVATSATGSLMIAGVQVATAR
jgi:hypothetical protein